MSRLRSDLPHVGFIKTRNQSSDQRSPLHCFFCGVLLTDITCHNFYRFMEINLLLDDIIDMIHMMQVITADTQSVPYFPAKMFPRNLQVTYANSCICRDKQKHIRPSFSVNMRTIIFYPVTNIQNRHSAGIYDLFINILVTPGMTIYPSLEAAYQTT